MKISLIFALIKGITNSPIFRESLELTERMATLETQDQLDFPEREVTLDPLDLTGTRVLPVTRDLLELTASLVTRVPVGPLE